MKIVALDSHTLDHDGLSWSIFEPLGEIQCFPRTTSAELIERARGAEALLSNKVVLNADAIKNLPDLKYIGITATGFNNVDIAAAKERGITVTNVSGYSTWSTAQHAMALILELSARVGDYASLVEDGEWPKSIDFCMPRFPTIELNDKSIAIIGYGAIGKKVAAMAKGFGMKVLVAALADREYADDDNRIPLEELLKEADFVSLHCPLTPDTEHIINKESLAHMKPSAFLINTARGPLIDEQALADALERKAIAGAAVDVLSTEPPKADNPLLSAPNMLITPHIAWLSREARERLLEETFMNLKAYTEGTARNVVS